ncbi:MAG: glycosyltransferase family 2 protein, partial [Acidocella sp.]|nr:glycosyltransferase family 2 protein [Acidocella sp.]
MNSHSSQHPASITPSPFIGLSNARPARLAILIPCHNEAVTIAKVITDARSALPGAAIYVYDNNSTDNTRAIAAAAGAIVRREPLQGKGHVIRRMFADIEADAYVLVDGDDTYDLTNIAAMVDLLVYDQLDMVNGARVEETGGQDNAAYRRGHRLGNIMLSGMVRAVFGDRIKDMLSGCRVFSRRFVKSFPALAAGFETETEFTIHALDLMMPIAEMPVLYRERPCGSSSKLRTYTDGLRILRAIVVLIKEERPLQFFSANGVVLLALGIALGTPIILHYLQTGMVPKLPTAVLATGIILLSMLAFSCGLILDSVARGRREAKRLAALTIPRWQADQHHDHCALNTRTDES